jgi:hypothetical protein
MSRASFASRLAITLAALLVMACAVATSLNYFKFEKIIVAQQARVLMVTAHDMADTLERSINLGMRLIGVPGAQGLLDASWASDRTIRRISVVDTGGVVLFDTDRSAIGQSQPAMLRHGDAGRSGQTMASGLLWIAAPIVNGFQQTEGTLLLAYDPAAAQARLNAIALEIIRPTVLVLAIGIPLAILLCFVLTRATRSGFAAVERAMLGLEATGPEPAAAVSVRGAVASAEQALETAEHNIEAAAALRDEARAA